MILRKLFADHSQRYIDLGDVFNVFPRATKRYDEIIESDYHELAEKWKKEITAFIRIEGQEKEVPLFEDATNCLYTERGHLFLEL